MHHKSHFRKNLFSSEPLELKASQSQTLVSSLSFLTPGFWVLQRTPEASRREESLAAAQRKQKGIGNRKIWKHVLVLGNYPTNPARRSKIEELKTDLGGCLQLQEDVWEQTQKLSLPDKQDKETQNKSPSMWSENGIRADLKKLCSI
eukprot:XP_016860920.1 uncharacterized protein LOC107985770 isoform X3 [Homo sapiens]